MILYTVIAPAVRLNIKISSCQYRNFHWEVKTGYLYRNSNSMEIPFHSHLDSSTVIATKFCTWHDSCAVVACAKFCCDLMASNGIMARRSFHRIWIAGKKPLVKRAPGHWFLPLQGLFRKADMFGIRPYSQFCFDHVSTFTCPKTRRTVGQRSPSLEVSIKLRDVPLKVILPRRNRRPSF